jgi:hypothetical protein
MSTLAHIGHDITVLNDGSLYCLDDDELITNESAPGAIDAYICRKQITYPQPTALRLRLEQQCRL